MNTLEDQWRRNGSQEMLDECSIVRKCHCCRPEMGYTLYTVSLEPGPFTFGLSLNALVYKVNTYQKVVLGI
jgi:hypothetical protein